MRDRYGFDLPERTPDIGACDWCRSPVGKRQRVSFITEFSGMVDAWVCDGCAPNAYIGRAS